MTKRHGVMQCVTCGIGVIGQAHFSHKEVRIFKVLLQVLLIWDVDRLFQEPKVSSLCLHTCFLKFIIGIPCVGAQTQSNLNLLNLSQINYSCLAFTLIWHDQLID